MEISSKTSKSDQSLQIFFKGNSTEFLAYFKKAIDFLIDPAVCQPPDNNFWKVSDYIIKPGSYIFLSSNRKSKSFIESFFKQIKSKNSEYLLDIVLVGLSWLKLDIDSLPKSDENFNYIIFEGRILKILKNKQKITKKLLSKFIRPQSWVWFAELTD